MRTETSQKSRIWSASGVETAGTALLGILPLLILLFTGTGLFFSCAETGVEDTEAPTVELISPPDSSLVYGRIELKAAASDNIGVDHVNYFIGDSLLNLQTLNSPPYTWYLNSTALEDRTFYTLEAIAVDNADNISAAAGAVIYVKNEGRGPLLPLYFRSTAQGKHYADLEWEGSLDRRFERYELYRSLRDSSAFPDSAIVVITDRAVVSYRDTGRGESPFGLVDSSTYYYRLGIFNNDSLSSMSQTLTVQTKIPAKLQWLDGGIAGTDKRSISLRWHPLSAEDRADLAALQVMRSSSRDSIRYFSIPDTLYRNPWTDDSLAAGTDYSYSIRQVDSLGFGSPWSSTLKASTEKFSYLPRINSIIGKNEVQFWFSPYFDNDFKRYEVFMDSAAVDSADPGLPLFSRGDRDSVFFNIRGLKSNVRYYLLIRISDVFGNLSDKHWSFSTLAVETPELLPEWVEKYNIDLLWSEYDPRYTDFAEYRLYRLPVETDDWTLLQPIFRTDERMSLRQRVADLAPGTNYFFRAVHLDSSGNTGVSPVTRVLTDILNGVEISDVSPVSGGYEISWDWSGEAEEALDHFELFRRSRSEGSDTWGPENMIGTGSDMQWTDLDTDEGSEYAYRVELVDGAGHRISSRSEGLDCGAQPGATLMFTDLTEHSLTFRWYFKDREQDLTNFYRHYLYSSGKGNFPAHPDSAAADELQLHAVINRRDISTFSEYNAVSGLRYFRLYTENLCGELGASNVVPAVLNP